ncbi:caspase domain-containing protein [Mycena latifolia]|nr:caspase domain-containing protein [Mycena latifolia]
MSGINNPIDLTELRRLALRAITRLVGKDEEPDSQESLFKDMQQVISRLAGRQPGGLRLRPGRESAIDDKHAEDLEVVAQCEKALWVYYGLAGVLVPDELFKECQRRFRNADPRSDYKSWQEAKDDLSILDRLHQYRKQRSISFASEQPTGHWTGLTKVEPTEDMRSKGNRFWAVIIGNDSYPGSPLGGCINDALLVMRFIATYLNVPPDHIVLLRDAERDTIVNALYDLRDNQKIQRGDNILIHYSGHGSSYSAKDYFTTPAAKVGSVEAICPIDRSKDGSEDTVPDICERELNSILSEIRAAKGPNITIFFDCCHSGGSLRSLGDTVRYITPVQGKKALEMMFDAAEKHPRRHLDSPLTSETWEADISSFVQLAACQDFQLAEESNVELTELNDDSEDKEPVGRAPRLMSHTARPSPRYGRFTWALIKILESKMGADATYASVIKAMGPLGQMQVPVAVGTRKDSRLWFEPEA